MKQPELHPGKLVMIEVAVRSLLLKTTKGDPHFDAEDKCPQEKTLPQDYLFRLFGQFP